MYNMLVSMYIFQVLFQSTKHLESPSGPEVGKKPGKKKGRGKSSFVSAEVNQTFKELKGRVIQLRARELKILTGMNIFNIFL